MSALEAVFNLNFVSIKLIFSSTTPPSFVCFLTQRCVEHIYDMIHLLLRALIVNPDYFHAGFTPQRKHNISKDVRREIVPVSLLRLFSQFEKIVFHNWKLYSRLTRWSLVVIKIPMWRHGKENRISALGTDFLTGGSCEVYSDEKVP